MINKNKIHKTKKINEESDNENRNKEDKKAMSNIQNEIEKCELNLKKNIEITIDIDQDNSVFKWQMKDDREQDSW